MPFRSSSATATRRAEHSLIDHEVVATILTRDDQERRRQWILSRARQLARRLTEVDGASTEDSDGLAHQQ